MINIQHDLLSNLTQKADLTFQPIHSNYFQRAEKESL